MRENTEQRLNPGRAPTKKKTSSAAGLRGLRGPCAGAPRLSGHLQLQSGHLGRVVWVPSGEVRVLGHQLLSAYFRGTLPQKSWYKGASGGPSCSSWGTQPSIVFLGVPLPGHGVSCMFVSAFYLLAVPSESCPTRLYQVGIRQRNISCIMRANPVWPGRVGFPLVTWHGQSKQQKFREGTKRTFRNITSQPISHPRIASSVGHAHTHKPYTNIKT